MKKSLSIIMSLLLAVQPAFGAFEGVKEKAVSVKEAMDRSRAVLKENWQCFRSGTGPNCTKDQRSALRIVQDFVSGRWAKARTDLKEFYKKHETAISITVGLVAALAVVASIVGVIAIGAKFDKAGDIKHAEEFAERKASVTVPSNPGVDVKKTVYEYYYEPTSILGTMETPQLRRRETKRNMLNFLYSRSGNLHSFDIAAIAPLMDKLGWDTKINGKSLIEIVIGLDKILGTPVQYRERIFLIDKLVERGANLMPYREKYRRLKELAEQAAKLEEERRNL